MTNDDERCTCDPELPWHLAGCPEYPPPPAPRAGALEALESLLKTFTDMSKKLTQENSHIKANAWFGAGVLVQAKIDELVALTPAPARNGCIDHGIERDPDCGRCWDAMAADEGRMMFGKSAPAEADVAIYDEATGTGVGTGSSVAGAVLDNTHEQMNPKQTGNLCSNCGHSLYYHSKEMGCHISRGSFNDGKRCHNTAPYHCQEFQPAEGSDA